MSNDAKTYDFKQVAVIVGGRQISGFAEGDDAITIEYDEDHFGLKVGADGEATRSKSNNYAATIKIKLQGSSDSNDVLSGFYNADKLGNGGIVPFMLKDNSGRDLHAAEKLWVQKPPQVAHGMNVGDREWTLRTGNLTSNFGGNT